jgi:flagellin-like hook-associated protein FlgL
VLVVDESRPAAPGEVRDRRRHVLWMKWVAVAVSAAAFGCALGYLVHDEVQANDRYDRSRASLEVTRRNVAAATEQLAVARRELALVTAQVGSDSTALTQDESQLQAAQSALGAALAHVSRQETQIGALHTCLGGVEQALNALAVNRQGRAILALRAVATSCTEATSSG